MNNSFSKIIAVGGYLPSNCVSNEELSKTVDTSDEWIVERTGIKFRHIAEDGEYTSDLASKALLDALSKFQVNTDELDGIIVATTTPDVIFPSTACLVQKKIGMRHGFAFDISAVCSGFIYAVSIANAMIKSGAAKRIAVIGSETMSRILDWGDRSTCVLFGDGAGAVILEASEREGIIDVSIASDGNFENILNVPGGVSMGNMDASIFMNGRDVYRHAVEKFVSVSKEQLEQNNFAVQDLNWYIPHQANKRIIDAVGMRMGIDLDKVVVTVDMHANTSAATIPLALNEIYKSGKLKGGDLIQMPALGAGLTWGSLLMRWIEKS